MAKKPKKEKLKVKENAAIKEEKKPLKEEASEEKSYFTKIQEKNIQLIVDSCRSFMEKSVESLSNNINSELAKAKTNLVSELTDEVKKNSDSPEKAETFEIVRCIEEIAGRLADDLEEKIYAKCLKHLKHIEG